jgi:hypothetical protein
MCFSIIKVISVRINPPQVVIPRTYAALCEELYRGSNIQGYHWRHEVRKNEHRQRSEGRY